MRHRRFRLSHSRGFTLIELVLVVVLAGILAATAFSRFDVGDFQRQGFFEQALAAARYAQKYAIASDCDVQFTLDNTGFSVLQRQYCDPTSTTNPFNTGNFNVPVLDPSKGASTPFTESLPSGVTVATTSVIFNGLGQPVDASDSPLTGNTTFQIGSPSFVVEAETGYVH